MQTLKLKAHIDTNGMLQLQMPPEVKDMDVEILVAFEPKAEEKKVKTAVAKGWQPGFFEKVIGGWQGEPLVRDAKYSNPKWVMKNSEARNRVSSTNPVSKISQII